MSTEKIKFGRSNVFFDPFERRPGPIKTNMHYCPGCGHGILHKLIAEAIEHYGIQENTVFIAPVGCAVFAYYYFNCGSISVPHGRAPAVGTGAARATPEKYVISYQGDGDLGAIGFNEFIQAANRGEKMAIFFVNNSNYGMTGGQMAPTTLPNQVTMTSPYGRNVETEGYPMKVCELVNALEAPVYIERVALTGTANILKARKAVFKAIENLKNRKGFSLVEALSPCPVNLKMTAEQVNEFIDTKMTQFFPLGVLRDRSAETPAGCVPEEPVRDPEGVKKLLFTAKEEGTADAEKIVNNSELFNDERRIRVSGFGGQGILSLGHTLADMARLRDFNVSWMPSYGPEQRGGSASCAVILSRKAIPSPLVDSCDLLIAMTKAALDKFGYQLKDDGILIYDTSAMEKPEVKPGQKVFGLDALAIANRIGNAKCANSAVLGALAAILGKYALTSEDAADYEKVFTEAITESFRKKPKVVEQNIAAFNAGREEMASQLA